MVGHRGEGGRARAGPRWKVLFQLTGWAEAALQADRGPEHEIPEAGKLHSQACPPPQARPPWGGRVAMAPVQSPSQRGLDYFTTTFFDHWERHQKC